MKDKLELLKAMNGIVSGLMAHMYNNGMESMDEIIKDINDMTPDLEKGNSHEINISMFTVRANIIMQLMLMKELNDNREDLIKLINSMRENLDSLEAVSMEEK